MELFLFQVNVLYLENIGSQSHNFISKLLSMSQSERSTVPGALSVWVVPFSVCRFKILCKQISSFFSFMQTDVLFHVYKENVFYFTYDYHNIKCIYVDFIYNKLLVSHSCYIFSILSAYQRWDRWC